MKCNKNKQVKVGLKIESEHTKSFPLKMKIVSDHLKENPCYYTYLVKMEKNWKKK